MALLAHVAGAQGIGVFEHENAVGRERRVRPATYDAVRQSYLIAGSGQNMWGEHDDFHLVWKRLTGNFILATRARFVGKGLEEHRKIGWTIRSSLETSASHVSAVVHGNGLASLQFRRVAAGATEELK